MFRDCAREDVSCRWNGRRGLSTLSGIFHFSARSSTVGNLRSPSWAVYSSSIAEYRNKDGVRSKRFLKNNIQTFYEICELRPCLCASKCLSRLALVWYNTHTHTHTYASSTFNESICPVFRHPTARITRKNNTKHMCYCYSILCCINSSGLNSLFVYYYVPGCL